MSIADSECWHIADKSLASRIFLGTSRYPSPASLRASILASGAEVVTVSLRRETAASASNSGQSFWRTISDLPIKVLPNTAGCYSVDEAVTTAHMARDLFGTNWIKLEVIGDDYTLQPDPFGLVEAARILVRDGFQVFPYTNDDLIVARRLVEAGCGVLMPWASPIGSGQGLSNVGALKTLRANFPLLPMIIDAGIGRPSHAAAAMELGFDAVLLNTAVSSAGDPPAMAAAFGEAIVAGRRGYLAGLMAPREFAVPSTPIIGQPFCDNDLRTAIKCPHQ